jgi:Protein of unknown function (DUF3054)
VSRAETHVPGTSVRRLADAAAIVVFATIGQLSHHGHVTATDYAEDALPFLATWFAADRPFGGRFVPTWLAGVSAGVLLRATILSHWYAKELAFWLVALATIGALAGAGRLLVALYGRVRLRTAASP